MITEYGEGADDRAVSAPSFISKALDTTLRFGGNGEDTRMELEIGRASCRERV